MRQCRTEHLAMQSPHAVTTHANDLRLAVLPVPAGAQTSQLAQANAPGTIIRTRRDNARRLLPAPPLPVIPRLPSAVPPMNAPFEDQHGCSLKKTSFAHPGMNAMSDACHTNSLDFSAYGLCPQRESITSIVRAG